MKKTRKAYERYLNELHSDIPPRDLFAKYIYFTNKDRGISISERSLWYWIYSFQIGVLLRKYDSIAFNVGYNEWNP